MPHEFEKNPRRKDTRPRHKKTRPDAGKPQAADRPPVGADMVRAAAALTPDQTRSSAVDRFRGRYKNLGL
jgi:hypothetical protein